MEVVLIRLITQAHRNGTEFQVSDAGELLVRGVAPPAELVAQRDTVRNLLLAEACVACAGDVWIREHGTALPWCRPCANQRGRQLLRAERPNLVDDPREVA